MAYIISKMTFQTIEIPRTIFVKTTANQALTFVNKIDF